MHFNDISDISRNTLEENILKLKTKNSISSAKNGLKRLKNAFPILDTPPDEFFENAVAGKNNRRLTKRPELQLSTVNRKINKVGNKKLMLSYRFMKATGLRVSEVAALKKEDITFTDDGFNVFVSKGKGGKSGNVKALTDPYLHKELKEHLDSVENKVFYSASYMKKRAWELGFECHDLRRVFAQTTYKHSKLEGKDHHEAKKEVQDALRHDRASNTKRYLSRKINFEGVNVNV